MAHIKSISFRYVMVYYNRRRIYTTNPGAGPNDLSRTNAGSRVEISFIQAKCFLGPYPTVKE
ncbi:hypothetical protein B0G52_101122 [Cohnella sp. SGD-V74]|nr:hypothetical protein B0G52_101122 [Cohnella sp. SGD-V74]